MSQLKPEVRAALLFALWHHQGGSSKVGQPIRKILGMGQHDRIEDNDLVNAQRVHGLLSAPPHPVAKVCPLPFGGSSGTSWAIDHPGLPIGTRLFLGPQAAPAQMTLKEAVSAVVEKHGGVRAAALATAVDKSFISRLMNGHKVAPSDETLRLLGLRAVPLYEVLATENVSNEPATTREEKL